MNSTARKLESRPGPARVGAVSSRQASKLFGSMFGMMDVKRRLTVLEIGPALSETVEFFSHYRCKLHFVDLFNEPFIRDQQAKLSEKELRHAFEEQFRFAEDTKIDLVLLWDFLSYLDDPGLRAFNSALQPWLHSGSRAHGFGVHHLAIRLDNIQYGIINKDTFSVRKRLTDQMSYFPHSQIEMHEMLTSFDFERGLLLPDGKLEMLLKPRD